MSLKHDHPSSLRSAMAGLFVALLLWPSPALANAGVPMLFVTMPGMLAGLLPVIAIEAWAYRRWLGLAWPAGFKASTFANLASTLVGVPLTWGALVLVEMVVGSSSFNMDSVWGRIGSVTLQAPWLVPHEKDLHWMIPAAATVLMVPFFYVSWLVERLLVWAMVGGDKAAVRAATFKANLISYLLFAALILISLLLF